MRTFTSRPLEIPPLAPGRAISRADLVFYGVEHETDSYEVRIFLDRPDADHTTPIETKSGYAGHFTVFGHGGCFGDEGHCDPNARVSDEFDLRLPNKATPHTKIVRVTEVVRRVDADAVTVRLVCVQPGAEAAEPSDELSFSSLRLLTYE
jgi:hypothetical protein